MIIPRSQPLGIMIHGLHEDGKKKISQGSINFKKLENIIKKYKYRILKPDTWLDYLKKNKLKKNHLCITFDDNLASHFVFTKKILDKYKIKAFFFIYTSVYKSKNKIFEIFRYFYNKRFKNFAKFYIRFEEFILKETNISKKNIFIKSKNYLNKYKFYSIEDKKFRYLRDEIFSKDYFEHLIKKFMNNYKFDYKSKNLEKKIWLSKKMIKILSDNGHEIGLHSHTHNRSLYKMNYSDQLDEFSKNYNIIKNITKKKSRSASYPFNSFNKYTIKILKKLKIEVSFLSNNNKIYNNNPLKLSRIDIAEL
jgi:peptidoglycan/xylan/chitin deacetylase (PgdA/CDA1 family)